MKPLVSVVIPAYNKGDIIKETIDSALAQTYPNIEIIVINDGSTDNTAEIVKSIKDDRIKYYYQPNSGLPAKPRNKGVELAKGEYVAFLDHDDLWMENKLEKQISIIEKDPQIALVTSNALFILTDKKTNIPIIKGVKSGYFNDRDFLPEMNVIQSTALIKKSVFIEMKGFDESPDLRAAEDYDLWLRMYPKYLCYYLNDCLAYYRKYDSSSSGNKYGCLKIALDHYNKYFISYGFPEKINKKRLSSILHHLSCQQYLSNDKNHLENARKAYQFDRNILYLLFYIFFLLPKRVTAPLKKIISNLRKLTG